MRKRSLRLVGFAPLVIAILLSAFLAGLSVQPVQAATTSELKVASDISNGTYTSAEWDTMMSDPAIGDITPALVQNNTATSQSLSSTNSQLGISTSLSSSSCPSGSTQYFTARYWNYRAWTGHIMYRWHYAVWFCRNNNTDKITKFVRRADWITDAAWPVNFTSDVVSWTTSVPASKADAFRQRHIQLCYATQFVCANRYAWGQYRMFGNGSPTYVQGSAG